MSFGLKSCSISQPGGTSVFTGTTGGAFLTKDHASSNLTTLLVNTTNPGSGSLLTDFQVGGSSVFSVDAEGNIEAAGTGFRSDQFGLIVRGGGYHAWSSGAVTGSPDLFLYRDAANTLAQRNSTAAQEFRLYGTYTSASDYERLSIGTDGSGNYTISTEYAGNGEARDLIFGNDGDVILNGGNRAAHIADVSGSPSGSNSTIISNLITAVNAHTAALKSHGIVATS